MGTVAIREHYLSSSLLAICLFLVALSVTDCQKSRYSMLGEKDSLYIYIFHPILIRICSIFFLKTGLYEAYYFVAPLIILITTLILIYSLKRIRLIK
jgi:fucose 4-O-acetylase-like acetyltransferase